jgi:hypothetical protein
MVARARTVLACLVVLSAVGCKQPAKPVAKVAGASDGGPAEYDGGLPVSVFQAPPPCDPHVDGTDADHKVFPVESVTRTTHGKGTTTFELVLLDTTGACAFPETKPLAYHAFTARITVDGDKLHPGHYAVGNGPNDAKIAIVSGAGPTPEKVLPATGGFIDLYALTEGEAETDLPKLSGGFTVQTASGSSFGCFNATRCPPAPVK